MDSVQAFAPGSVTGLFSVHEDDDLLCRGSLGAGFCLALGVTTKVRFHEEPKDQFLLNDDPSSNTDVSKTVIRLFHKKIGERKSHPLLVHHQTILPIGYGFGTSGSAALSLALALNAFYGSPLSFFEAASLAHLAELECMTGLGTILGESSGGINLSLTPGAPGKGRVYRFQHPPDLKAVFLIFGPLLTKNMLKEKELLKKINHFGKVLHQELQNNPTVEQFLKLSYQFSLHVGLMSPSLQEIQKSLAKQGLICPMLMFGDGLYTLVRASELSSTVNAFYAQQGNGSVFTSDIDLQGGRVINEAF